MILTLILTQIFTLTYPYPYPYSAPEPNPYPNTNPKPNPNSVGLANLFWIQTREPGGGVLDFGLDGGVPPGPRDPNPCLE